MKKNMGSTDKIIKLVIAAIVAGLFFAKIITGTLAIVLAVLAGIFVLTSLASSCPIYSIFGLDTCSLEEK